MPQLHDPARPVPLSSLVDGITVEPANFNAISVTGLTDDSRRVMPGDLFLAMPGVNRDHSREHIEVALEKGARAVLTDSAAGLQGVHHCTGLREKVSLIASRYFEGPSRSLRVTGITGTNGKSSVCHLLANALAKLCSPRDVGLLGTLGNGLVGRSEPADLTTPGAVDVQAWLASFRDHGAGDAVMEVSSHGLDQARVAAVRFSVAGFTNLTRDHLDYHGTLAAYAEAKMRLFELQEVQAGSYNAADPLAAEIRQRSMRRYPLLGWSLEPVPEADLVPGTVDCLASGLRMGGKWREKTWTIHSPLIGRFNAENLLAALSCLLLMGYEPADAAEVLSAVPAAEGRMQRIDGGPGQPAIVVDFAHSPDALQKTLEALRPLCVGRLVCVFGCGGDRDTGKRALMGAVAERLADRVIVTSDNPRSENPLDIIEDILTGMSRIGAACIEVDRGRAIERAVRECAPGDLILIAGKGHEGYQEIEGIRRPFSDHATALQALGKSAPC
jgi:UDP-N-acetylmuramoyl-L-alanyl-D-glutamate--2,6-diaminopimelate ligase